MITDILERKPVADFLEAVDTVLNSNTFLLYLPFINADITRQKWQEKLLTYLGSDQLDNDILDNDYFRKWFNYTTLDEKALEKNELVNLLQILFFKRKNKVKINAFFPKKRGISQEDYLTAMLTDERTIKIQETGVTFYSPYNKGLSMVQAKEMTQDFITCLFEKENWQLWTINPDFMYSRYEFENLSQEAKTDPFGKEYICYFEGKEWFATDTASLLLGEKESFLLLTNGID